MEKKIGLKKGMNHLLRNLRWTPIIALSLLIGIAFLLFQLFNSESLTEKQSPFLSESETDHSEATSSKEEGGFPSRVLNRSLLDRGNSDNPAISEESSIEEVILRLTDTQSEYLFLKDSDSKAIEENDSTPSIYNYTNIERLISKGLVASDIIKNHIKKESNPEKLSLLCYAFLKINGGNIENLTDIADQANEVEQQKRIGDAILIAINWSEK